MAQQSPDYKLLYEQELKKNRNTTLVEFLDACHVHLHNSLNVQTDSKLSTQGDPSNAKAKVRPEEIVEWSEFPKSQAAIWKDLQKSNFMHERHFSSIQSLTEWGVTIYDRMMSSELDLNNFERDCVENQIASIIKHMYNSPSLRKKFCLKGSIKFENHANTLSPEEEIKANMQHLSISENRRSRRLLAQYPNPPENFALEPTTGTAAIKMKTTRPRADQFCVYNISSGTEDKNIRVPAFIIEYKAPHKLDLACIHEGLKDMKLEEVINSHKTQSPQDHFRRLVAAAITQAFSYMIQAGLEYGYVCTGEAFIFLRVPENPQTVYYFLSVPKNDVGSTTGLVSDPSGKNRLHLTAVGQVLAFTLQALKSPIRGHSWQANAFARLKTWEVVYDELLKNVSEDSICSSEYRPRQNDFLRMSPIRLRPRLAPAGSSGCQLSSDDDQFSDDGSDPDPDPDPETPSRTRRQQTAKNLTQKPGPVTKKSSVQSSHPRDNNMLYCTQKCLRGLVHGGSLDKTCPNINDHGESNNHEIDQPTFLKLIHQQLSKDLDHDCMPVGIHGARGALFMIRLTSYGYTVAAKCTTIDFVAHLKREAIIYEQLRPIQGFHVPVYLGSVDLDQSYIYDGICELVHMMFLSFGGQCLARYHDSLIGEQMIQQVKRSFQAIHHLGVLHRDVAQRNMLWDAKQNQLMIIDFERAEIQESRSVLGTISPNRKRKRATTTTTTRTKRAATQQKQLNDVFLGEVRLAVRALGVR